MNYLRIFFFSLAIFSTQAYSKESAHIVTGSSSSSLNIEKTSTFDDSYEANFGLNLGYDYAFAGGLQLGGNLGASIFSAGSVWALSFGPGYNFNTDVENSFFTSLKFGLISIHATDLNVSDTDTLLMLDFGKRFKLMENVSYVPGVTVTKVLGKYSPDPTITLELFRLALVF